MRPSNINVLLTRRCNLNCSSCRLVHDYKDSPYKLINDFVEASPVQWMELIQNIDPVFTCLYGGEPLMYHGIKNLVELMNKNEKYYTIITNGLLLKKYFKNYKSSQVPRGLSMSFDGFGADLQDYQFKSNVAYNFFTQKLHLKYGIEDPLIIFTAGMHNYRDFKKTVEHFTSLGVYTELTVLDSPKTKFYDFAEGSSLELNKDFETLFSVAMDLKNAGYLVHNSIDAIEILKAHYDGSYKCRSPYGALTIDPDMSPRLCLRIRGIETPKTNILDKDNILKSMQIDQYNLCKGCSWNCVQATDVANESNTSISDIIYHGKESN